MGKQVRNGEFLVLTGIDANAIHAVSREDEVLDRLRKRVGVEPAYHLVPLGLEEGLRPHVNVGEERHAHPGFGADLVVLVFEGEMEVIDVENVACLTERTGDTHDVVGHQSCFQNLLVSTVSVITAPLREQAGHLACFIFKTPHQVAVFGVAWFIDQADGHRFVVVALVPRIFGEET